MRRRRVLESFMGWVATTVRVDDDEVDRVTPDVQDT